MLGKGTQQPAGRQAKVSIDHRECTGDAACTNATGPRGNTRAILWDEPCTCIEYEVHVGLHDGVCMINTLYAMFFIFIYMTGCVTIGLCAWGIDPSQLTSSPTVHVGCIWRCASVIYHTYCKLSIQLNNFFVSNLINTIFEYCVLSWPSGLIHRTQALVLYGAMSNNCWICAW